VHSCLYEGVVRHARHEPVGHAFQYPLYLVYLDLEELDRVFAGRWLWSAGRPAVAWFRRGDHLGDPQRPLAECVRELVRDKLGMEATGPIRLLTQLRHFGYVMNPVSFYYCYDAGGTAVEFVVAEVHNTPWGERHCYALDVRRDGLDAAGEVAQRKEFHVSPFMGMDMEYRFRLETPGERLGVGIVNLSAGRRLFEASLRLQRTEISTQSLARVLVIHPWISARVFGAIYWQALKLWWKRVPYHPHPGGLAERTSSP